MIRLSLLVLSIFSLIYGVYFLFFPSNFVNLTAADETNIAWLRNIGASITGLLFIGLLYIYINPKKHILPARLPPSSYASALCVSPLLGSGAGLKDDCERRS